MLERHVDWLTSNGIFETVPVRCHWIAVNFRLVRFKTGIPGALDRDSRNGMKGYTCPLAYIWGVVGLQLFKRIPMFDDISVLLAFLAGKIFMLHLLDMHPCFKPITYAWIAQESEWITPFAYIRRISRMAFTPAIIGSILEIVCVPAFDIAENASGLGVRAVIRCLVCFKQIRGGGS
jgi:hypothetical protein